MEEQMTFNMAYFDSMTPHQYMVCLADYFKERTRVAELERRLNGNHITNKAA
jgi:hypothetical protein